MDKLIFGISGLPMGNGSEKFTYVTGIEYLHSLGLSAMELPFVRSVNITDKNREAVKATREKYNFHLTAHGSYFINMNAKEIDKKEKSIERLEKGIVALSSVGGTDIIFHPGFYLDSTKEDAYNSINEELGKLPIIPGSYYRLETTGKETQFGNLKELCNLVKNHEHVKLCVDFSHIHARYNGILKEYDDFAKIFEFIGEHLGKDALKDFHVHLSGIEYTAKGEKNHLPFEESDFNITECLRAFVKYDVKGCIICESPILEKDALLMKNIYENI